MALFSQRKGLKPLEKTIQRDALDAETRGRLWTVLKVHIWDKWNQSQEYDRDAAAVQTFLDRLWFNYFKRPNDSQPPMHAGLHFHGKDYYTLLRDLVLAGDWNEVFDLIEFAYATLPNRISAEVTPVLNRVLTEENSAYRLVNEQFVEITNDSEIQEVDAAAQVGLGGVAEHISAAVKLLSDRKQPDYRNSIKESISAVESLFKVLTQNKSATLSDGLKAVKASFEIHPALFQGFEKIYAYTSDQGGIRHALFDSDKTSFSDAKFMLVSCSAFINYVVGKLAENGKTLG